MIRLYLNKRDIVREIQEYLMNEQVIKELGEPLLLRPNDVFGCYDINGETKAFFCINIKSGKCFLRYVYVDPEFRGNGIFSELMNTVDDVCVKQEVKEINAVSTNMALNLYVKRGYEIKKQFTNYHKIRKTL